MKVTVKVGRPARDAFLALAVLLAPLPADAQPQARATRIIGELMFGDAQATAPYMKALRRALRDLGYVEGQHIIVGLSPDSPTAESTAFPVSLPTSSA